MVFKVVSVFIILTEIICVYGQQKKFVIENKKTGKVIEDVEQGHKVTEWDNTDLQLWTLEPKGNGYRIVNVASGYYIICPVNGTDYEVWKLSIQGDTHIQVEQPSTFLWDNDKLRCSSKKNDETDVWKFIEQSKKVNMTFAIENKKTGQILEERDVTLGIGQWNNKNSQLWTLKPHNKSGYSIANAASGRVLAYSNSGKGQEVWKFNTRGDTWIHDDDANIFLAQKNGKPVFVEYKQNDDSDKWLFVEREINNTNIRQIYAERYQERFVIENKNTGMVMEQTGGIHKVMEWYNRDSQLWTLKAQNNSGYLLSNVATKRTIVCTINGTEYNTWKLNTQNDTRIEIENPTIIIYPSMGDSILRCSRSKHGDKSDIWIFIERSKKINMKFAIENKKTGKILDGTDGGLTMGNWENRNSQLWSVKLQNESGYSVVNVANGRVLTYSKNGTEDELWKLNIHGDTRIQIGHVFLVNKNGKPVFLEYKQDDDSDIWRFVQRESTENNTQPKRIYVEGYQEKFVIQNKKTKRVLSVLQRYLVTGEWEDTDLQLWTLESQNKSGCFIVRNIEDRGVLTYNNNGTDYQIWKLNIQGETWIQPEDTNVYLADKDGEVIFVENKQDDGSDRWLLVDHRSKRANMKSKPIYIEAQLLKDIVF